MALTGKTDYSPTTFLEQVPTGPLSTFGDAVQASMLDNPVSRISTNMEIVDADNLARQKNLPFLTKEQAQKQANEKGIPVNITADQLSQGALDIMLDRQYQKKKLGSSLSQSDYDALALAGGFVGGMADPINLASAFIPVPGLNGLTAQLGKAGASVFTKAMVRAQIGAIEGAVGAAILEPTINAPLAQMIGDEYGLADSATNIFAGAIAGSLLHPLVGGASDFVKGKFAKTNEAAIKFQDKVNAMPVEVKAAYTEATMAQAMDDRPINTEFIDKVRANKTFQEWNTLNDKFTEAAARDDQDLMDFYKTQMTLREREMADFVDSEAKGFKPFSKEEIDTAYKNANEGKGDRYASPKTIEEQKIELDESPYNDIEKNFETLMQEEELSFNEAMDQMELDGKKALEADDQKIKEIEELDTFSKAYANCITRGV